MPQSSCRSPISGKHHISLVIAALFYGRRFVTNAAEHCSSYVATCNNYGRNLPRNSQVNIAVWVQVRKTACVPFRTGRCEFHRACSRSLPPIIELQAFFVLGRVNVYTFSHCTCTVGFQHLPLGSDRGSTRDL